MVASLRALSSVSKIVQYFYYTEKDLEASSGWYKSKAVEALGLKSITKEAFENVLSGKLAEGIELGQRTKDGIKHHPGHDLTFSAPKSASIMALVAGDERVLKAHEAAVSRALDYVQKHLIHTRIQEDGNLRLERTDNAIIAKFTHITSRPTDEITKPDPQLHTHCIIANATLCTDGVWRSVVFDDTYESKMLVGEIYRTEFINRLTPIGYGVDITRTSKGRFMFEIAGVSQEDIDTLSRRRQDILREAKKRGVTEAADLADIALSTRKNKSKSKYSREELQKEWETRVQSMSALKDLIQEPKPKVRVAKKSKPDTALKYGISHLSNREAVFTKQSLHSAMVEHLAECFATHNIDTSDIENTIEAGIKSGKLLYKHGDNLLTTPKNIKDEKQVIKLMQAMRGKVKPIAKKHEIRAHLKERKNLNVGKIDAITLVLTTRNRMVGIQGSAGTGKTTIMSIIREISESKGISMMGLAPTKAAVSVLKKHIPAHTLSYFLARYDGVIHKRGSKEALQKLKAEFSKKLIVVDEVSLASTLQIKNFSKLAQILKFRIVQTGDTRQLGSIPAGKQFYYLQDNGMDTAVMGEIKRQQNDDLLESVYLAESAVDKEQREAAKIIEKIIAKLGENVIDASTLPGEENVARIAYKTWLSLKDKDPMVIAPSHRLREQINELIRPHFVTGEDITIKTLVNKNMTPVQMKYARRYIKGDVLRFGKDISALGIKGGEYFQVESVVENTLRLQQGERLVDYDPSHKARVEVYEAKDMKIAVGDRIRWTRNSQKHDFIVNGNVAVVRSINEDTIEFDTKYGIKRLSRSDPDMQHTDHAYTSTAYRVQGMSASHVICVLDSRLHESLLTQRALYVMISRAKHGVTLVTDNIAKATRKLSNSTGAKTSAIEHQEKIQNQKGVINLNRARREYFSVEPDTEKFKPPENQNQNPLRHTEVDTEEINRRLKDELLRFLPGGIKRGSKFYVGDVEGNKGKSLVVELSGSRTGLWHDFSTGAGGNVLGLFAAAKGLDIKRDFREVILSAQEFLGSGAFHRAPSAVPATNMQKVLHGEQEVNKKVAQVLRLLKDSEQVQGTLAAEYLNKHRKIDISQLKLSDDIRFIKRAYSSDTKSYHPALLVTGRDEKGNIRSAQITYLNPTTQNKNKALSVVKRSMGALKGSFVDFTTNKGAKDIFIAEGVETALSIALAQPNARVICSLGCSNLRHIDVGTNKNIIICADNDEKPEREKEPGASKLFVESTTRHLITEAAKALASKGNSVSIIMPDQAKTDFNDVLKIYGTKKLNQYIAPTVVQELNYKKICEKLYKKITYTKRQAFSAEKKVQRAYSNPKSALLKIKEALNSKDPNVLAALKTTPEKFGELVEPKLDATKQLEKHAGSLVLNSKLARIYTQKLEQLTKSVRARISDRFVSFDTTSKNIQVLEPILEREVFHALKVTDNRCDFESVEKVTLKLAEQIVESRERFGKEPSSQQRLEFFLRARYELEREPYIKKQLVKAKMYADKTPDMAMALEDKLTRALSVDSRLANKDSLYYKPASFSKVRSELTQGDKKMLKLTDATMLKGVECRTKAEFIGREIVKYEDRNGTHLPPSHRETLDAIGNYVSHGYNMLTKQGLTPLAASRIMCKEGAHLALYHNKHATRLQVSEQSVKSVQKTSGQFYRALQSCAAKCTSTAKSSEMEIGA